MTQFKGVFPALVTPFDSGGRIDERGIEKLVAYNVEKGVAGFYVGGSTAESFMLTAEERMHVLEVVMAAVSGKAQVIANIGLFSTEQGIQLAQHADRLGVSAISSVPPFYYKFTMPEYIQYYSDILAAVSVPMLIYNVPAMSGVQFAEQDFAQFFTHERIIGVKYTSYDLFLMQKLIQQYPQKNILIGHDEIYLSALAAGAQALIGSTVGLMAEKFIEIERLFRSGRTEEALQIQGIVNRIVSVLVKVGVFKGVKAALEMRGIPCGPCRKPFQPLSAEELDLIKHAMKFL